MILRLKLPHRLKSFSFLIALVILFNTNSASADAHLSVQVSDSLAFRDYFSVNGRFGGLLSDFIELADGTYNIEVYGPPYPNMFYTLRINVEVVKSKPEVRSVSFNSDCVAEGGQSRVDEWATPVVMRDEHFSEAFRLVIGNPIITKRDKSCTPQWPPAILSPLRGSGKKSTEESREETMPTEKSLGGWANNKVLKLKTTSTPAGAEVWVRGKYSGNTDATINVPYRDEQERINVVIRMPGYVNCQWQLKGSFKGEAKLHCIQKTP